MRVLVVDDEPEYLDELLEALDFRGLGAVAVGRGDEGIEMLRADRTIGIVLTDLRMPDMDGIAMIRAIQAAFPERGIRFLAMTGHAAPDDVARAFEAGVVRCFPKPLPFDELCDALAEMSGPGAGQP